MYLRDNVKQEIIDNNLVLKKSKGQNFLTDNESLEKISDLCGDYNRTIIEIGPGSGTLTSKLQCKYKKVYAFEIDETFIPVLNNKFEKCDNVEIINCDFLKLDFDKFYNERLLNEKVSICTNLPYNISSQATEKLFYYSKYFENIVMLIQKEFAEKVTNTRSNDKKIPLTYICEYKSYAKKCFNISPNKFIPQPKVMSTVVKFEIKKINSFKYEEEMFDIIYKTFLQRRKTIVNSLSQYYSKDLILNSIKKSNLNESCRPEELSMNDFLKFTSNLH